MKVHNFQLFILLIGWSLSLSAGPSDVLSRPMPESWGYSPSFSQTLPTDDKWWQGFEDPVLDSLIRMGEEANFNVAMAMSRMEDARQQMRIARSAYFPQLGLQGGYERSRIDGTSLNTYTAGAQMSWQVDLFGRVGAQVKRQKHLYRASRADYTAAMVAMAAEIAADYVQLRVFQGELAVAKAHITRQDTIAAIAKTRYEVGLAARIDVEQANSILHSTQANVPALETSIHSTINALALLTGRYGHELRDMLAPSRPLPEYHRIVTAGVPAQLLRRRPDIVAAESQLAASAEAVGIAKKDYLPTLSLTGNVGVSSHGHGSFFSSDNFTYSIAPTLSWTLFDGMARNARVASAREEMEAQIEQYNLTVMTAYNEVDNAVAAYINALRQIDRYEQAAMDAERFLKLSLDLYTQGLSGFTNVADAQESFLQYANSVISSRGLALNYLIQIYQALGGGYE